MTPKSEDRKVFLVGLENFSLYYLVDSQVVISRLDSSKRVAAKLDGSQATSDAPPRTDD